MQNFFKSVPVFSRVLFVFFMTSSLLACGGGAGKSEDDKKGDENNNNKTVAVITTSKEIAVVGEKFVLDGSKSYYSEINNNKKQFSKIVKYEWFIDANNALDVELKNTHKKQSNFTVNSKLGTAYLSFILKVTDVNGKTARAKKTIEFKGDSISLPVAVISNAPVESTMKESFILDGSESYYSDENGNDDQYENIKKWEWHQKAGDNIRVQLENEETQKLSITVPDSFVNDKENKNKIHIILTVTDKYKRTARKEIAITMTGGDAENPVVAIIDAPGSARPETLIKLQGQRSYYDNGKPDNNRFENIVSHIWTQKSTDSHQVILIVDENNKANVSFVVPILPAGVETLDLNFTLKVKDIHRRKDSQSILIRVSEKILYSVAGKITIKSDSHMDGDINNPRADYIPNDTFETAQHITNPAQVLGYINRIGKGPNGRSTKNGDRADFYKFKIKAGQKLKIQYFLGNIETGESKGSEGDIPDEEEKPKVLMKSDNNFDMYIYDGANNLITRFDTLHYCRLIDKEGKPNVDACLLGPSKISDDQNSTNYIQTFKFPDGGEYYKLTAIYDFAGLPASDDYHIQVYAGLGAGNYKLSVINSDNTFDDVPLAIPFSLLDVVLFDPYDVLIDSKVLYKKQASTEGSQGGELGVFHYILTDIAAGKYHMLASADMDNDGRYAPFLLEPSAHPKGLMFNQLDVEKNIENEDYDLEINSF